MRSGCAWVIGAGGPFPPMWLFTTGLCCRPLSSGDMQRRLLGTPCIFGSPAPPPPQDPSPLRGTPGSSLRSPAEGEGNEGFPVTGPQPLSSLRRAGNRASRPGHRALARSTLLRDWIPCTGAVLSLAQTRGAAGSPRFPRLLPGTLGNFPGCL